MPANYVLLEKVTLSANAASVVLDNIPQTGYTDLKIVVSARTARASNGDYVLLSFNGAEANSARGLWGYGTTVVSDSTTNNGLIVPGNNATASTFGNLEVYCPNYTSSTNKSISIDASSEDNASDSNGNKISTFLWSSGSASTSAVTSITLAGRFASFLSGSTFSLYGVADVNTTPTVAPLATGGNIVGNDGTYWIHTFLTSGTFTTQNNLTCDYLVVAGGGGGGGDVAGGGGAGGLLSGTSLAVPAASYAIAVGAGGVGGVLAGGTSGANGNNSVFSSITSTGGGAGGGYTLNGGSGGSGGGGGTGNSAGGAAGSGGTASPSGQGNNGGAGVVHTGTNYGSGGGGGAGSAGGAGGQAVSGTRGAGIANSYSGSSVTYATGGLGGKYPGDYTLYAGTANTGDGGDGANGNSAGGNNNGRTGGSGIVIIRYAMA